jgi:hypothetical protein
VIGSKPCGIHDVSLSLPPSSFLISLFESHACNSVAGFELNNKQTFEMGWISERVVSKEGDPNSSYTAHMMCVVL